MGRTRTAAVVVIVALATLPGCTEPDGDRAQPATAPSVVADPGPVSTASAIPPPSHTTFSATTLPARSTAAEATSPEPIQISYPPETYSVPEYIICGLQTSPWWGFTYITADLAPANPEFAVLPPVLTDVYGSVGVVFGADCAHGGSVEVSPRSSATVHSMASSSAGTLVGAEIIHTAGATTVVTIRPDDGSAPTVVTVHWVR